MISSTPVLVHIDLIFTSHSDEEALELIKAEPKTDSTGMLYFCLTNAIISLHYSGC